MAKLSLELNRYFFEESRTATVTLADILALAGERLFGFLLVILALPSALPIPTLVIRHLLALRCFCWQFS